MVVDGYTVAWAIAHSVDDIPKVIRRLVEKAEKKIESSKDASYEEKVRLLNQWKEFIKQ